MEKQCKIITWNTYRKTLTEIRSVSDNCKGWARTIVKPTMLYHGFRSQTENDIDLDPRKPKKILLEDFKDIIEKSELIVYFVAIPTGNYAGYYKYLDIYYKPKTD